MTFVLIVFYLLFFCSNTGSDSNVCCVITLGKLFFFSYVVWIVPHIVLILFNLFFYFNIASKTYLCTEIGIKIGDLQKKKNEESLGERDK